MTNPAEFNLSEKIIPPTCHKNYENIKIEDVKEFIRLCEDNSEEINGKSYIQISKMQRFAGEKLKWNAHIVKKKWK